MSKYQKAISIDQNAIFDWQIEAITKSRKVGRSLDGHEAFRSKLFWLKLPDGKVTHLFILLIIIHRMYQILPD